MYSRLTFLLMLLTSSSLIAQTTVGGSVSGVWSRAASPYLLIADVLVSAGDTLIIESNATVDMGSQYQLRIEGLLIATEAHIGNGGELFAAGGHLVFTSCEFNGLTSGIRIYGGRAEIEACLIDSTAGTGVTFSGADSSFVYNSRIMNSGDYGIKIRTSNAVEVVRNTFSGNSTNDFNHPALFIDSASPEIIEHNIIEDNHAQGIGVWSLVSTAHPTIRHNIIRRNFTGITLVDALAFIENNTIVANYVEGNINSGAGIYAGYSNSTPIVMSNYIAGNYYGVSNILNANCNLGDMINDYPGDDGLNIFLNNIVDGGETWNIWNDTPNQLLAQNNYWPGMLLSDVDATLWDNEEGGGEILYEPIYVPDLPSVADINGDTAINILDVVLIIEGLLSEDVPEAVFFYLTDINNDYNLDVSDVVAALEIVLGE